MGLALTVQPVPDPLLDGVREEIARYYTAKISRHGATPLGVDWTCMPTQELRFVQLLKAVDFLVPFSLNDVGCGYGALLAYLARRHGQADIDYLGIDLSAEMIRCARRLWRDHASAGFVRTDAAPRVADYSVASGIFNVRQGQPDDIWERFVAQTLIQMHATSRRGFAVNFLLPPQPDRLARPGVYQTAPEPWARWCERQLGVSVDVLEDYGMREFTLLVHQPIDKNPVSADALR